MHPRADASRLTGFLASIGVSAMLGCAGALPANVGQTDRPLAPCPSSPNCVASDASDAEHGISPLAFDGDPSRAWEAAQAAVATLPRTRIITVSDTTLHAECASAVFRFVDDLELRLQADAGVIAVRSASRVGYGDWGVNRRRVENLRQRFTAATSSD